jgi:hypothetical protein
MKKPILTLATLSVLGACSMPERQNLTLFSLLGMGGSDLTGPANLPPPGYVGEYWVDTKGCVFIKTGTAGDISWVPQVTAQRKPICDPTRAGQDIDPATVSTSDAPFVSQVFTDPETGLKTETVAPVAIPETFVQIGLFSDVSRAMSIRIQFASLGYPVVGDLVDKGPSVILGPFTVQSALDDALQMATELGFPDAFAYQDK